MKNVFFVFLGGGLGSILRYASTKYLNPILTNFYLGTFSANVIACFLLGLFTGLYFKEADKDFVKHFMLIGVCGGFSTYSTFTNDTFQLLEAGNWTLAFANVASNLLVCLLAIFIGMWISKTVF